MIFLEEDYSKNKITFNGENITYEKLSKSIGVSPQALYFRQMYNYDLQTLQNEISYKMTDDTESLIKFYQNKNEFCDYLWNPENKFKATDTKIYLSLKDMSTMTGLSIDGIIDMLFLDINIDEMFYIDFSKIEFPNFRKIPDFKPFNKKATDKKNNTNTKQYFIDEGLSLTKQQISDFVGISISGVSSRMTNGKQGYELLKKEEQPVQLIISKIIKSVKNNKARKELILKLLRD